MGRRKKTGEIFIWDEEENCMVFNTKLPYGYNFILGYAEETYKYEIPKKSNKQLKGGLI